MKPKLFAPAIFLVVTFGSPAENVSVNRSASRTLTRTGTGPSGPREILITLNDTETLFREGGPKVLGTLTTIFDPNSGLVWHQHGARSPERAIDTSKLWLHEHFRFAITGSELVVIATYQYGIRISRSSEHFASNEAALSYAATRLQNYGAGEALGSAFKGIDLRGAFGEWFFITDGPMFFPILERVERTENGWSIDVKNIRGEVKTVDLTPNFELVPEAVADQGPRVVKLVLVKQREASLVAKPRCKATC